MRDFDVVVVGGGCSGLWAARAAAMAGANTLLVEKATRIGERIVCAEGVGADGMAELVDLKPEWVATTIDRVNLFAPGEKTVEFTEQGCGYVLNKGIFLLGLSRMAAEAGVEMWPGTRATAVKALDSGGVRIDVEAPGRNRTITAGAVVAADGVEASIARQVGIHDGLRAEDVFSCAQYTVAPIDADPHTVEFHFGTEISPGGYAWVFPKGDSVANVGVGVIPGVSADRKPAEYLETFKRRRCPESKILAYVVGGVPTVKDPSRASKSGVFLAGDAAGITDPVSGAGIVPGMESGAVAGEHAVRYAATGSDGRAVEKEFAASLKSLLKDRRIRYAVRKVLSNMDDKELARMIEATGEYVAGGKTIRGDPFRLVKFMVKVMPNTFGIIKHIVRV
ncbi:MAG: NAD(P)/FAD-dependent oxidoreductase [Candidatus Eisenbacteria bacterium]